MLKDLKELAEELGKTPTLVDLDAEDGIACAASYKKVFGKYSIACELAGLPPNHRKISDEKLIEDLQELSMKLGRTPKTSDLKSHGCASDTVYCIRFGSFSEALKRAGIEDNRPRRPKTNEQLLEGIKKIAVILGHTPSYTEAEILGLSPRTCAERFGGSWRNAVRAAGLVPVKRGRKWGR